MAKQMVTISLVLSTARRLSSLFKHRLMSCTNAAAQEFGLHTEANLYPQKAALGTSYRAVLGLC